MADLEIDVPSLEGKLQDLDSIKNGSVNTLVTDFESSYISKISNSIISSLKDIVKAPIDRYKNGFNESSSWFSDYLSELNTIESGLASFSGTNVTAPKAFKGSFEDIFGKVTMPVLKTNGDALANYKTFGNAEETTEVTTDPATGEIITNGNIISTSSPVEKGTSYSISDEDLNYLAYVAKREQGSVEGAKLELSLMVNLYEKNKSKYKNVVDYVKRSGWFGSRSTQNYKYPGNDYVNVAKDVIKDGNKYLPSNIVEHDCLSDITSINTGSKSNRSNYIPGKTVIKNKYGATYVFVGFAPNGGDPFGYLV